MTLIIFADNTAFWAERDKQYPGMKGTVNVRDGNGRGISGRLKIADREYDVKYGTCTVKSGMFEKGTLNVRFTPEGRNVIECEKLRCFGDGGFTPDGMDIESEIIKIRKYIDRLSAEINKKKKDDSVKILPFLAI